MNVYFFGTPEFAVPVLKIIASDPFFNIQKVVTQPDKPGNRNKLTPPPVKTAAKELLLPISQPEKIDAALIQEITDAAPDAIIVVAYGGLIPKELLNLPKYGCINIHPSLLPKYRGASPIQEALLNGDTETGIAFMVLDEGLDDGDILLIKRLPIEESETLEQLNSRLSQTSAALLPFVLRDYQQGTLRPIPQEHSKATMCKKIKKEDGLLTPKTQTAQEIINKIRALNPWPGTFIKIKDKTLKILEAEIIPAQTEDTPAPGSITKLDKRRFIIQTAQGTILPKKVQLEGKKPQTAQEFLNGNSSLLD